jgi:hypothetical protein
MRQFIGLHAAVVLVFLLIGCAPNYPATQFAEDRFSKLSSSGTEVPLLDGPWSCVKDRHNGLTWEVKSPNENIQFALNSLNFDLDGTVRNGSCARDDGAQDWVEYDRCNVGDLIRQLNNKKLCGIGGWRIPTADEFKTIMVSVPDPGQRRILPTLFPRVVYGPYWTSTRTISGAEHRFLTIHSTIKREVFVDPARVAFVMLVSDEK